ncbi:hypothetical protein BI364_16230 [Acidihalobacter yilgarnensis]|uniref:Lipoprotein n=1 Tax=Acidihalobacter yilgarnensis TaxID=2819280 RepID=A0A1D8IS33_9GAMM|nr:hypothetical protein [Acidihalobacter yilgarnensis]AOU99276.1 hypothetical protein BI364_16230 [Acidihalobacter yilgarnensis]
MLRWVLKSLAVATALLALAGCTAVPLKPAAPISVPSGLSHGQVRQAILSALTGRGWTIDHTGKRKILSTLYLRGHSATVRIDYSQSSVDITYVSSNKLEYHIQNGKPYIHRNYNGWVGYLESDIRRNLQNSRYTSGN